MSLLSRKPHLPQRDPKAEQRLTELSQARAIYNFSYTYPEGVAMAEKVPHSDTFSPLFLSKVGELDLAIISNHAASKAADWIGEDEAHSAHFQEVASKLRALDPTELKSHMTTVSHAVAEKIGKRRAKDVEEYAHLYGTINLPGVFDEFETDEAARRALGWQRVAGPNPMMLRRIRAIPDNFPVTEAHFESAMGNGDSLAAALSEGRAFLVDYKILDGAPLGTTGGYQKHVWAPLGLFVRENSEPFGLVPVAIQCEQRPSEMNPVITPNAGVMWRIARTVLQIACGNVHQSQVHLAHTHLIMEAVILSAHRELAKNHPLHILLEPHWKFTLALNEIARTNLIAPNGQVDYVLGTTLEASIGAVKAGLETYRMTERYLPTELSLRGVDDPNGIIDYPYRDDGLLVWGVLREWVEGYVGLYYGSPEDIQQDEELQAFIRTLSSDSGGRIKGVPSLETLDSVVDLFTHIIFTATAQHAAVNFPQFSFMGFVPNMPGAAYAPLPAPNEATEEHYLAMLPPLDQSSRQFDVTYQLSNLRDSILGHYPFLHFHDHRVHRLQRAFVAKLELVEESIAKRNTSRFLPYPFLLPSKIPGSIHI